MSIYQSDRYGFNNPDVEWNKKEIEFFLVGDSFTHGYCVNEPDTISGNLRSMLNQGGGVLNLGQGGNGPLIEYATLKEYLPIANTKRVLWIYYEGNDVKDTREESKNSFLSNYLNDINFSQDLKSKQKKINQNLFIKLQLQINLERIRNPVIKFLILTELRSSTIEKLFLIFNASPTPLNPGYEELERNIFLEFEKIIKLSKELSEKNEAKFYFVYLPDFSRYLDNSKNNNKEFYNYQKVVQTINNLNVKIIDLNTDLFSDHPDFKSLFSQRNGHYNELGYRLVAKTIFKKIREYENIK
jgi:lysophospholipase L1-like esterase